MNIIKNLTPAINYSINSIKEETINLINQRNIIIAAIAFAALSLFAAACYFGSIFKKREKEIKAIPQLSPQPKPVQMPIINDPESAKEIIFTPEISEKETEKVANQVEPEVVKFTDPQKALLAYGDVYHEIESVINQGLLTFDDDVIFKKYQINEILAPLTEKQRKGRLNALHFMINVAYIHTLPNYTKEYFKEEKECLALLGCPYSPPKKDNDYKVDLKMNIVKIEGLSGSLNSVKDKVNSYFYDKLLQESGLDTKQKIAKFNVVFQFYNDCKAILLQRQSNSQLTWSNNVHSQLAAIIQNKDLLEIFHSSEKSEWHLYEYIKIHQLIKFA